MNKKKLIIASVALVVVVALMLGIWLLTRPKSPSEGTAEGGKSFTVEVVHADGSTKTFTYQTETELLGEFLYDEGLLIADESNPGMFHTVDGEKADWNENQSYWGFYLGDDYATEGVETTVIEDGVTYRFVYTIG